jgi:hypothetical protein
MMWQDWNVLAYRFSQTLDLFIRDRSPLSLIAHETEYARVSQNSQPLLGFLRDANEGIATKQWDVDFAPSVAPPMNLLEHWKKRADSLFRQLRGNPLLMARHGMNRVPILFLRRET